MISSLTKAMLDTPWPPAAENCEYLKISGPASWTWLSNIDLILLGPDEYPPSPAAKTSDEYFPTWKTASGQTTAAATCT